MIRNFCVWYVVSPQVHTYLGRYSHISIVSVAKVSQLKVEEKKAGKN